MRNYAWRPAAALLLVAAALATPAVAGAALELPSKEQHGLEDLDARTGRVTPTDAQKQLADSMGASVRWNRFGTPQSLINHHGYLATGVEGPGAAAAARNWLAANKALFRLSSLDSLELDHDAELRGSDGHAVIFRQVFGGLPAGEDGLLVVGVSGSPAAGWNVGYASSSVSGETALGGAATLSAAEAWTRAAADVGRGVSVVDLKDPKQVNGWTHFAVDGYSVAQARPVAVPLPGRSARSAFETLLVDLRGETTAYRSFVDARNGRVLVRHDVVHHSHTPTPASFSGTAPEHACDAPKLIGTVHADSPKIASIELAATFAIPSNDMVLILRKDGVAVQAQDSGTSPEAIHYEPSTGVGPGTYEAQACEFHSPAVSVSPRTYTGVAHFNLAGASTAFSHPPKWNVFPAYPKPATIPSYPYGIPDDDIRKTFCWDSNVQGTPIAGCDEEVKNLAARAPWDFDTKAGLPTFTTRGNNANSGESWTGELITIGAFQWHPVSLQRDYDFEWTNDWYHAQLPGQPQGCAQVSGNPERSFVPGVGFDISSAAVNLFVMHNRMHDWAYHLGFTEENYNAQDDNFGETPPSRENDNLIGNVQEGGLAGPTPVLGRTNANMVPLPDGVHAITNMYLWQPFAGVIYVPCVDGDLDMGVIGHEYGHLIENRLEGKGGGRAGFHAGSMGEGWGDLIGMEILNEYGYIPVTDENPYMIGAYVSGNRERTIRNYPINDSALNFSDIGYDPSTGNEVHADGEVWAAANWEVRQALVNKYNSAFKSSNKALQRDCANGVRPAQLCPGNRRWIQLAFDAMLLMPAAPSMLDARDAFLAADLLRFGGENQNELWLAFARRGFGQGASVVDFNDGDPEPDFASAKGRNTTVTFVARDARTGAAIEDAKIYVGDLEARVSPIADTDPDTALDAKAGFASGTYRFIANAPGYGHLRAKRTFVDRTDTFVLSFQRNLASSASGATAIGEGDAGELVDDTEATAWQGIGPIFPEPSLGEQKVTIDLAGDVQRVRRFQVSAMGQPGESGKFSWLRQFEIWACSTNCVSGGTVNDAAFTRVLQSAPDAFPGDVPWPVTPQVQLRAFTLPSAVRATHVQFRALTNQCTGQPAFHGEQDSDLANPTDCVTSPISFPFGSNWIVTAAEVQVFS